MNGIVKFYNNLKNFGFITGEDGTDYFVHMSGIKEGVTMNENTKVSFDIVEGERGPKAENVELFSEE